MKKTNDVVESNIHYFFNKKEYEKNLKRSILSLIGFYYFERNSSNSVEAIKEINLPVIKDVEYNKGKVTIHAERPGVIIGERGSNINSLREYLKRKPIEVVFAMKGKIYKRLFNVDKIAINEVKNNILSYLFSFQCDY